MFDLIVYLAENPGRTISKEELVREVWDEAFVTDAALKRAVSEARRALGDDGSVQRIIRTVPKRGYLLRVEVTPADHDARARIAPNAGRWLLLAAALLLLTLTVAVLWRLSSPSFRDGRADAAPVPPAVEVEGFEQLTSTPGLELFPTLSPDARFVAYASREAGDWDIQLLRVGGSRAINLTRDSPADDVQPAISPAGDQIVFRSERDGGGIFVMGATGESVQRVSRDGFNPSWSAGGKRILYSTRSGWSWLDAGGGALHWVLLDTGERGRVGRITNAGLPSWSPGGHRIAYSAIGTGPGAGASKPGTRNVWTVLPTGEGPVPATAGDDLDWNPVFSATGHTLYFVSDRAGSFDIWGVPIDERTGEVLGEPRPVTSGVGAEPRHLSVSADGRSLAYAAYRESTGLQRVSFDPVTAEVGAPAWLSRTSISESFPSVSPDGRWLAFKSGDVGDIIVMRPDGGARRRLTEGPHRDLHPRWSPDSERIAFFSNRSGSYEIWTIRPDGSGLTQLTDVPDRIVADPTWSPDGDRMAYIHMEDRSSYIVELEADRVAGPPDPLPPVPGTGGTFGAWSWSPDGERIAGHFYGDDLEPEGLGLYSLGTRSYTRLSDVGSVPTWLGDSRRLVFHHAGRLHLIDSETGERRELLDLSPNTVHHNFSVAGDDRAIYFTRVVGEADLWLLKLASEP